MKLTLEQKSQLEQLRRTTKSVDEYNRCSVILSVDNGISMDIIISVLGISRSSAYNYAKEYKDTAKTIGEKPPGKTSFLNDSDTELLIQHLRNNTYMNAHHIVDYIHTTFGILYSCKGLVKWLHRYNFKWIKPKQIPKHNNPELQRLHIEMYQALKDNLQSDEVILFMDAMHPEHQSKAVYGWIHKDDKKTIESTGTQKRMHINGAIDVSNYELFCEEYATIDGNSTIDFFSKLEFIYEDKKNIIVISDNGRSYKNKQVAEYLNRPDCRIKLLFLPAYSPNLNPIERVWKKVKEHVCYNQIYEHFADFRDKIRKFLITDHHLHKQRLSSYVNDNFQIIYANPVQVSR
jgi:transposase